MTYLPNLLLFCSKPLYFVRLGLVIHKIEINRLSGYFGIRHAVYIPIVINNTLLPIDKVDVSGIEYQSNLKNLSKKPLIPFSDELI
jgi:hypothetical protein